MSDPNAKPNLSQTISATAGLKLTARGVPEHKVSEKLESAYFWGGIAGLCILLCLVFVVLAAISQFHGGSPSVVLLAIELGVPGVVAIYCAYKADSEGVNALLATLRNVRGLIKGKED